MRLSLPVLWIVLLAAGRGDVAPSPLFRDHAVLQRDRPVPVWGVAAPGESITVTFGDHTAVATADAAGAWRVDLPALQAEATPRDLIIAGRTTRTVHDVIVGDVWLVSGQSNMAWKLADDADAALELPGSARHVIRQLKVERTISADPATTVAAAWTPAGPDTAGSFSAVAWHFAAAVHQATGVPIGIVNATWGNTPIEAWLPAAAGPRATPDATEPYQAPSVLFNGMIHPLAPAALRGILWYQGESNVARAETYAASFRDLIVAWRGLFAQGDLPFYWVQLPGYLGEKPPRGDWPAVREAQATALALPATGQAVAIDLGEAPEPHPRAKREVGRRLARLALHRSYGLPVEDTGPVVTGAEFTANAVRVQFAAEGSAGLHARSASLVGFEVAGADHVFHPASARLAGAEVIVTAEAVPGAVRYAWRNWPEYSLFNAAGLPAAPFFRERR